MQIHNLIDLNKQNLDFPTHVKKTPQTGIYFYKSYI